jgi:hypothetical protein
MRPACDKICDKRPVWHIVRRTAGGFIGELMKAGEKFFLLTPKGAQELRDRSSKLDANAKNILSLVEQGYVTAETILQRSKAPRDQVVEALRSHLSQGFLATATSDGTTPSEASASSASVASSTSERLRLKPGISPAQARFLLSNFCLDQFGPKGQDLADVVGFCTDVTSLQLALDNIRTEVKMLMPERRPVLVECVREINETDY